MRSPRDGERVVPGKGLMELPWQVGESREDPMNVMLKE